MTRRENYQKELAKLTELFSDVDQAKAKLVQGLIHDAAFLYAENQELRELLSKTGMIKVHPKHPEMQKPVEAARQYLKNSNAYSVVIKTLNSILQKNSVDDDDPFDDFIREQTG